MTRTPNWFLMQSWKLLGLLCTFFFCKMQLRARWIPSDPLCKVLVLFESSFEQWSRSSSSNSPYRCTNVAGGFLGIILCMFYRLIVPEFSLDYMITFVLNSEGMTDCKPGEEVIFIETVCFFEKLPCKFIIFWKEIVKSDCIEGQWVFGVVFCEEVAQIVQISKVLSF